MAMLRAMNEPWAGVTLNDVAVPEVSVPPV
jgi:hypothetical protein